MHICCFTLREQNHVYISVRGDLWPYKIPQIRLPDPAGGAYDDPQTPQSAGEGDILSPDSTPSARLDPRAFDARLRSDKFYLKNVLLLL